MEEKKGYLEEAPGQRSMMRVTSLLSFFAACGCALGTFMTSNPNGLWLTTMFLGGAFAPKTFQKFAELKKG